MTRERKNGRTNERKNRRRNADRRKALLPWRRPRPRLKREAHIYRRSTAVLAPRSLSSQGTQLQARLPGTWRRHVLRIPLSGRYPPLPVPVQRATTRPSRSARGMMPKAAQARVASPPAGTALARAARECLPGRVRYRRGSEGTILVTYVNDTVTSFRHCRACLGFPERTSSRRPDARLRGAIQSGCEKRYGLLRRFAPRNDEIRAQPR